MNLLKKLIKSNRLTYRLAVFIIDGRIIYALHRLLNRPFIFRLLNKSKIKFFPKGQISFSIFSNRFEKKELKILQNIIKPGMVVVDAGANIGLYTLIASELTGKKGKVFSFEPSKETFKRLINNIKLNNSLNVKAFNEGLGDNPNEKLILRQDMGYGDAERYLFSGNEAPDIELENINAIKIGEEIIIDTLDNKLEEMGVKKIDILKIDTEGFEYYILKGAEKVLKNSPDIVILMECTALGTLRAKTTQKDVFQILKDNNLNIFYWNTILNDWSDDSGIYNAGDVLVCKNKKQLL